jgi:LCP family protein required for cell wall assembly
MSGSDPSPSDDPSAVEPSGGPSEDPRPRRVRGRTWPQRLVLTFNVVLAVSCFVTAALVFYGSEKANDRRVVALAQPADVELGAASSSVPGEPASTRPGETTTAPTLPPPVDLSARNFLITGSDNNACVDPDSPYASAFGDRSNMGERSDTIMIIRLDPVSNQGAVLSFPRDLWVEIAGKNSKSRINAAFDLDDPNRLVQTIWNNFQIPVDHYVNVDFCAFKNIVDAVGGVAVPFEYPVRDRSTGLDIRTTGCVTLDGEAGLAYVRSRHLKYLDPETGEYREDQSSDLGRISRQQDFLRRALKASLDAGVRDPRVAKELIDTALEYVILDAEMTAGKLLDLASAMRNLDPAGVRTYQIASTPRQISGNSVLVPQLESDNMQAILSVFRGQARLAEAPEQVLEQIYGTTTLAPSTTRPGTTGTTGASTTSPVTTSTLPLVLAEEDVYGIVPPADVAC